MLTRTPQLLYIIGCPGVGKTTTLRLALSDHSAEATLTHPFLHTFHTWYYDTSKDDGRAGFRIIELGARRDGGFGGTDALPMNVQPKVLEWLQSTQPAYVVAEGDRLANLKFFDAVRAMGYDLSIASLEAAPSAIEARRRARAETLGVPRQNASWVRGRETKVANILSRIRLWECTMEYDATQPPAQVATQLRHHAFFRELPPFLFESMELPR